MVMHSFKQNSSVEQTMQFEAQGVEKLTTDMLYNSNYSNHCNEYLWFKRHTNENYK